MIGSRARDGEHWLHDIKTTHVRSRTLDPPRCREAASRSIAPRLHTEEVGIECQDHPCVRVIDECIDGFSKSYSCSCPTIVFVDRAIIMEPGPRKTRKNSQRHALHGRRTRRLEQDPEPRAPI